VITGRKEDAVGKPLVYGTSKSFMDYLGINSPASLPELRELVNVDIVVPTAAAEALPEDVGGNMIVTEDGELIEGEEKTS
jgi:segregation and condensation protein B